MFLGFLFVAVSNVLLISQGDLIKKATDELAKQLNGSSPSDSHNFLLYAAALLSLALGSGFFMFLKRQFIIVVSRLIEADLKNEIFNHYQLLDVPFYKNNNTGDLMNRISEDVGKVRMYVGPAVMYIVDTFFTVATVLLFMLAENWKLTLIVFIPLPILSFTIFKVSNLINKRSTKVQEALSDLTSKAQESFSGIRLVKSFKVEKKIMSEFSEKSDIYRSSALSLNRSEALFQPVMMGMVGLSLVSIIYFGSLFYLNGEITVGSLPQFIFFVYKLTWPFASLGWVSSLIQRAAASQTRINQFLETKPIVSNPSHEQYTIQGNIEFRNVTVVYPESGIKALDEISLTMESGKVYALVGPTGSGKSTLASLITRIYDVSSGELLVDGMNIKNHNLQIIRNSTGYVPQESFLFSDTIAENIGFSLRNFKSSAKEGIEKIEIAAVISGIHSEIERFPLGYDTMVGERGIMLSGGQKQRISIARAICKQPKILLFDDCLSAVDTDTEDKILGNLNSYLGEKTTMIISHRISTVQHADKIFYLKGGKLIESGTHDQLLSIDGEYAKLAEMQKVR